MHIAAEAHLLEEPCTATSPRSTRASAASCSRGKAGRARAAQAAAALELLGRDVTLVPTRHPALDIVPFHLLTLDLAEARGVDPDLIRWDEPRWKAARDAYA